MRSKNASVRALVSVATVFASMNLWAQTPAKAGVAAKPTAPASANAEEKKVDISDLEHKYWAPKDTDFSVVQNRTYTKAKRWFLTPQYGRPLNDPYDEGNIFGGTANYFFSERFGVQATYLKADLGNNDSTDAVASYGSGIQPDHGRLTGHYSFGFNYVPFYAKMSFLGSRIIYFDMAFTPTIGMTQYDQVIEGGNKSKSSLTYGLDITQFFFFTNWLAVRADLKNQWYTQEIARYRTSGGIPTGAKLRDKTIHDTLFLIGLTFFY